VTSLKSAASSPDEKHISRSSCLLPSKEVTTTQESVVYDTMDESRKELLAARTEELMRSLQEEEGLSESEAARTMMEASTDYLIESSGRDAAQEICQDINRHIQQDSTDNVGNSPDGVLRSGSQVLIHRVTGPLSVLNDELYRVKRYDRQT